MIITADIYKLACELAHLRIATETRAPLEEVIETREDEQTYYTPKYEHLFTQYKEHYLTALKDYYNENQQQY